MAGLGGIGRVTRGASIASLAAAAIAATIATVSATVASIVATVLASVRAPTTGTGNRLPRVVDLAAVRLETGGEQERAEEQELPRHRVPFDARPRYRSSRRPAPARGAV